MTFTDANMREQYVLEACDKLVDFNVWPATKIDHHGWLRNFTGRDREIAVVLLSRFTFLSTRYVDQAFKAAFRNISNLITCRPSPPSAARSEWRRFLDEVIIVPVQGEDPNPTDSGASYARKSRQILRIDQERVLWPGQAIALLAGGYSGPIVFVDDFVGSGDQFLKTWTDLHWLQSGEFKSFDSLSQNRFVVYCNVMMTEFGKGRITQRAPRVHLASGNVIPRGHSLAEDHSLLWPTEMKHEGIDMVMRYGKMLGFTAEDGGQQDWRGYRKLGLGIAFEDSTPDANLPIFFGTANGWTPLVERL